MTFFKNNRMFVSFCTMVACSVCVFYLRRNKQINTNYFRFHCEKIFNQKKYDIVVFGNSRSHQNINYDIIQSYLPNARIFNFGWGGGGYLHPLIVKHGMRYLDPNGKRIFVYFLSKEALKGEIINSYYISILNFVAGLTKESSKKIFNVLEKITFHNSGIRQPIKYKDENWYIHDDYLLYTEQENKAIKSCFNKPHDFSFYFIKNLEYLKKNHIDLIVIHAPCSRLLRDDENQFFESMHLREIVANFGYRWLELEDLSYVSTDWLHLDIESGERFAHWFGKRLQKMLE